MYAALNRRLLRRTTDPCERRNKSGTAHRESRCPILRGPTSSAATSHPRYARVRWPLRSVHVCHEKLSRWEGCRLVVRSPREGDETGEEQWMRRNSRGLTYARLKLQIF